MGDLVIVQDIPRMVLDTMLDCAKERGITGYDARRQGALYSGVLLYSAIRHKLRVLPLHQARSLMTKGETPLPPENRVELEMLVWDVLSEKQRPTYMRTPLHFTSPPYGTHISDDPTYQDVYAAAGVDLDDLGLQYRSTTTPPAQDPESETHDYLGAIAHGILLGAAGASPARQYEFGFVWENESMLLQRAGRWIERLFRESLIVREWMPNKQKGISVENEILEIDLGRKAIADEPTTYLLCLSDVAEILGMKIPAIVN